MDNEVDEELFFQLLQKLDNEHPDQNTNSDEDSINLQPLLPGTDNQNNVNQDLDLTTHSDEECLKLLEKIETESQYTYEIHQNEHEPGTEHIQCLQMSFGHSQFRPSQWKVIRSIIEDKRDNCCIMATGYGKSLCFQFPPVFSNGIAFIISPLISLMQDQVKSLNGNTIAACMLGSAQSNKRIEEDIIKGAYRIVYASPEYICGSGSDLISKLRDKLTLIAVDEAHCISSWGADFRPKYLQLKNIRNDAPNVPILAVTATASERVQQDICTILKLRNPQMISTGFDRPNLEIMVRRKTNKPYNDVGLILRSKLLTNASCIIYCLTRKCTDRIYDELRRRGHKCGAYHAGKTQKQRVEVFDKFVRDEINVIVATVAFGMGVDKSDVRCVLHYGAPQDMDSYYQEIGRAGRDGLPSKCILFYSDRDFALHRFFRCHSKMSIADLLKAEDRSQAMRDFIHTKQCRRLTILQYFDGPSVNCPKLNICCDNCRSVPNTANINNKEVDFSIDAKIMLDAVRLFDGNCGPMKAISFIRGTKLKFIHQYLNHKLLGCGKHKSEQYWRTLVDLLHRQELLERQIIRKNNFSCTLIKTTLRAEQWLASGDPLKLIPNEQMFDTMTTTPTSSARSLYDASSTSVCNGTLSIDQKSNKFDEKLKTSLLTLRAMIASRENTLPYKIASEPAIDRLVRLQPLNLQELRNAALKGQFGPEFLKCIQRSKGFLLEKSIENMEEVPKCSNPFDKNNSANANIPSTRCSVSTVRHDNIPSISTEVNNTSDFKNAFDEDDDLFLMVDYENLNAISNGKQPAQLEVAAKRPTRITTIVSKRVKYESSSSSDEGESSAMVNGSTIRTTPQIPFQKPVGIRKRNIF